VSRDDFYASPFGAFYSAYMERPKVARRISRLVWGGDTGSYYESMQSIREVRSGGTIVDCPCGAGVAFRMAPPAENVRYLAVDLSPSMLTRARSRAQAGGLNNVELVKASATDIPLPPSSADLFLSYWGLHCFDDPAAAVGEAARILLPGGRLLGCTFVRGTDAFRQRLLVRPGLGDFGQVATATEITSYLEATGLDVRSIGRSGPMLFFDASRPA
jgi:ubiquinone/menaquinone biosynthesis C-methylase UbiE